MDILFLCVVVFLFLLAVFDLSVGHRVEGRIVQACSYCSLDRGLYRCGYE